ncbi:hypothetical protein [Candidatus Ichthyocystis sparus]|uniref:hypothetical protein n=1 Tax=Candidatus Ichthyocystis sparus TaxID=1561004 RepID=UPI001F5F5AD1|nr:hypothetical protein [Candidatus Ichthyocystis sparus]
MSSSNSNFITAPPGTKCLPGYVYQVVSPTHTPNPPALPGGLMVGSENASGFWDTAIPLGPPDVTGVVLSSHKCSATSAASGSSDCAHKHTHLTSAADFSPTHFLEPLSPAAIMVTAAPIIMSEPKGKGRVVHTPISSPLSHNPLLQAKDPRAIPTPSPTMKNLTSLHTHDGNTAWAAAEGLTPISNEFLAPGFVHVLPISRVTYSVCTLHAKSPTGTRNASQWDTQPSSKEKLPMHAASMHTVPSSPRAHRVCTLHLSPCVAVG